MDSNKASVLCAGYVNWDVVMHTDTIPDPDFSSDISADHMSSGGSATNTAMALASFGNSVTIFGGIGDDESGNQVRDALEEYGVNQSLVVGGSTTVIYALITDGCDPRYLARYNGAVSDFGLEDVDREKWNDADHVHVTSFSEDLSPDIAQKATGDGKTVSFNPSQGYEQNAFPEVIAASDLIFLNDREEEIFSDRYDFEDVVDTGTTIVVTHGSQGSTVHTEEAEISRLSADIDGSEIVDTIGAGDCFIGAFLSVWLDSGDVEEALETANATGAYAITQVGAPDTIDEDFVREKQDQIPS